jgi:hypothetical protein
MYDLTVRWRTLRSSTVRSLKSSVSTRLVIQLCECFCWFGIGVGFWFWTLIFIVLIQNECIPMISLCQLSVCHENVSIVGTYHTGGDFWVDISTNVLHTDGGTHYAIGMYKEKYWESGFSACCQSEQTEYRGVADVSLFTFHFFE